MTKYFYSGLLAVAVVGIMGIFFYTTVSLEKLSAHTAEFGGVSLKIEYATTEAQKEKGLSGRENIPDDYGMLFIFKEDSLHGFWMKDMLVPVDIFWLDAQGHVVSISQNVATSTYPSVLYPIVSARYVLETAEGFAKKHDITIGTLLRLKNPPNVSQ